MQNFSVVKEIKYRVVQITDNDLKGFPIHIKKNIKLWANHNILDLEATLL